MTSTRTRFSWLQTQHWALPLSSPTELYHWAPPLSSPTELSHWAIAKEPSLKSNLNNLNLMNKTLWNWEQDPFAYHHDQEWCSAVQASEARLVPHWLPFVVTSGESCSSSKNSQTPLRETKFDANNIYTHGPLLLDSNDQTTCLWLWYVRPG